MDNACPVCLMADGTGILFSVTEGRVSGWGVFTGLPFRFLPGRIMNHSHSF
jgi:hypothetical protein